MKKVQLQDLGLRDYAAVWHYQEGLFKDAIATKVARRRAASPAAGETRDHLLLVEHPPVYTLGKSGDLTHLLADRAELARRGAVFYRVDRGGDITYHGPGQLVAYPILDLDHFFTDIHRYLRCLEEVVIRVLADYGLEGMRAEGETGVWLEAHTPWARKICALGVRASRWVTMHGLAFNVNTDLRYFELIVPCGIRGKGVTSLQQELQHAVPMGAVKGQFKAHFEAVFEVELLSDGALPLP